MKDSGIAWIGEIPKEWETFKIKQLLRNKSIKGFPNERVLSLYRELGVVYKDSRDDNHNVTSEDTSSYKLVDEGDFVLNKMKAWQGSMAVSEYRGIISPAYYICSFEREDVCKRYIHYLLRNESYKPEYMRLSTGLRVGQWDLNIDTFLNIPMIFPPLPTQHHIATYLDTKCAEIDELVALQDKMIEELKAYKQSVITEAVTKGLDSNAKMKESGVEWIGEIPEGWEVKRLKEIIKGNLQYGANESGLPFDASLPRYIRITDILNNNLRDDIQMQSLSMETANDFLLKNNDILFARSGGTVGKAFIFKEKYGICCFAGYLIKASINHQNDANYIYYFTQTSSYVEWKNFIFIQSTIQNIGADKYSLLQLTIPPIEEQHQIATYLDEKCSEIDALIAIKQKKIEELKEYKKSLIYECVTGKKEVE